MNEGTTEVRIRGQRAGLADKGGEGRHRVQRRTRLLRPRAPGLSAVGSHTLLKAGGRVHGDQQRADRAPGRGASCRWGVCAWAVNKG